MRICDNGGWTDTWFGGPGRVVNIAVYPGVDVSIRATDGPDPVVLDVDTFDDYLSFLERFVDTLAERNQVALKSALAYDRDLCFDEPHEATADLVERSLA